MNRPFRSNSPPSPKARRPKRFIYIFLSLLALTLGLYLGSQFFNAAKKETKTVTKAVRNMATGQKKPKPSTGPVKDTVLEQKLATWATAHTGDYGISVRELNGKQRTATWQPDKKFVTASTYKMYLVYAIMHEIETGNRYTMASRIDTGQTVIACMDNMLIYSDNTCTESLGLLIGWPAIDSFIQANGFPSTSIDNYGPRKNLDRQTTATDMTNLMVRLATDKLVSDEHQVYITKNLKKQVYRERIPAGVPSTIAVADKPGFLPGIENDTAIVYGPKSTYVVSLFSTGSTPVKLAQASKLIYDYLQL